MANPRQQLPHRWSWTKPSTTPPVVAPRSIRPAAAALALVALMGVIVFAGCVPDGPRAPTTAAEGSLSPGAPTSGVTAEAADTTAPPQPLSRLQPDGVVLGFALETPLPLDETLALGKALGGDTIAVFRVDSALVRPLTGGMPDWEPVPSKFAYVDAGSIRERRIAAIDAGLSPPITGWLIAESFWLHWEDQWARAQDPGVLFDGLAVYLPPESMEAIRDDPRFRAVGVLPHRRTDSLDPGFPGELLLESEEFALR